MQYQRKEGESEFEYHKRLVYGKLVDKTLSDEDYLELSKEVYGKEYSSDVARRMMYGSRYTLELLDKYMTDKLEENTQCNSMIDSIKREKIELQKERYKIQSEKNEINKWIREQSRIELWEEKIRNIARELEPLKVPELQINKSINSKVGITGIADVHFGKLIDIKGLMGESLNQYNEEIFQSRMWNFLNELVFIIKKEELSRLDFHMLGDLVDGILRMSQIQSLQYGIVESVMKFSEFMANWFNEFSKHIVLDVYSVEGNHSEIRPLGSKAGEFPHENAEKLIVWYLQSRLSSNPNVKIHNSNKMNLTKVLGLNVLSIHGQDEKNLEQSLKDYSFMYGIDIDILLSGHLHSGNSKSIGLGEYGNVECIQFPSICSIDDFSMKLKKSAMAGSKLIVIEEDSRTRLTYDIVLN